MRVRLALAIFGLAALGNLGDAGEVRSIDGTGNSLQDPRRGAAGSWLLRLAEPDYEDRVTGPSGSLRPSARAISNALATEHGVVPNAAGVSDLFWLWGQFLDHDLSLTEPHDPPEPFDVPVPAGDPIFDPGWTGDRSIVVRRSRYDPLTGASRGNPRRQINQITAWIDASNVYGSDAVRAAALRRHDGSGELRTSRGRLLPRNGFGLPNHPGPAAAFYVAGDVRANEHAALTAMHTLWVREHNRQARQIRRLSPRLSGEEIYDLARARVGALMQVITYREFLPLLLGDDALPTYRGWRRSVDGGIAIEFSTAAFRFGHSMVSPRLLRLDSRGRPTAGGPLSLSRAFFAPGAIRPRTGIEPLLRGLAYQRAREIDTMVVDGLRDFLFAAPGAGGFDLAALNLQRGRDHAIPSWLEMRESLGLPPVRRFSDAVGDTELVARLEEVYPDITDVDLWAGGLAEDHVDGAMVGPVFHAVLVDQFRRLRDGDRFFYRRVFAGGELRRLESTRLADVIRRNTRIRGEIRDAVFLASER